MNRFADYFSNYVNDDTITYIGNGDISSFTVSRQNRELTVGVSFDSFVDYAVIDNAQNQIAQAMELKKVHLKPRFPKSQFSLDGIERILEYVRHETPAANGFFDGCEAELEDRTLTLCLKKGGKDVLESQKVDRAISNKIYELFDLDLVVNLLEVQTFDIEKAVKKAVEERLEEISSQTGQFYKGTLRSGQMLESESSIIILGDINPGAKVIAKGNVIILGSLKGNIYAGANGNEDAFVVALEMAPIQIRIGDTIARSDDNNGKPKKMGDGIMIAFVEDGNIYIEKLDKTILDDIRI